MNLILNSKNENLQIKKSYIKSKLLIIHFFLKNTFDYFLYIIVSARHKTNANYENLVFD